jgi:hypothetical protein
MPLAFIPPCGDLADTKAGNGIVDHHGSSVDPPSKGFTARGSWSTPWRQARIWSRLPDARQGDGLPGFRGDPAGNLRLLGGQ